MIIVDSESLRVIIPIATFILGSLFTLLLKRSEQRRDATRRAATELVRLTKEWYTQIHQILLRSAQSPEDEASSEILFDYIHNRLILPDLLLQLEILREHKPKSDLIPEVETFLAAVTNYREAKSKKGRVYCILVGAIHKDREEFFLRELDQSLQAITSKAARVLS